MIGSIVGNYRIVRELGRGGMGAVYLGEHTLLGRQAAIKLLRADLCEDREVVQRFFNEARASSLIRHGGIVDVLDFGQHEDGRAYLIMEFLSGESLGTRLDREIQLPAELAVRIAWQIAAALAAAHAKGIVHRDLKPDNLLLVPDEAVVGGVRVKILDFGIAKLSGHLDAGGVRTQTQISFGTPHYMSPEQLRSAARVDARTDIYALGCILYEMLGGRPPFVGDDLSAIANAHIFERVPPLALPLQPSLRSLVAAMLEKEPEQRPQSMAELGEALSAVQRDPSPPALPVPPRQSAEPEVEPMPAGLGGGASLADPQRRGVVSRAPTLHASAPAIPAVAIPAAAARAAAVRLAAAPEPGSPEAAPPVAEVPEARPESGPQPVVTTTLRGSAGELKRWGPGRKRSKSGLVAAVAVLGMVTVIVGIAVLRTLRERSARPPTYTQLWGDGGASPAGDGGTPPAAGADPAGAAAGADPAGAAAPAEVVCILSSNLAGARIAVDQNPTGHRISPAGTATLSLPPGHHEIALFAQGVRRGSWPVEVSAASRCELVLEVQRGTPPRMRGR
jgi:serine/threonine-protein kinase